MLFIAFQAATAITTCTDAAATAYSIFIPYINISTELTQHREIFIYKVWVGIFHPQPAE